MWYYLTKFAITASLIVLISELAKRHSGLAALLAALPITSVMAIIWLKLEGTNSGQIADLSYQIFWLVIPSLGFFLVFPTMLKQGLAFWPSLGCASLITLLCYLITLQVLRRLGILFAL